jgi:hypothetical protein
METKVVDFDANDDRVCYTFCEAGLCDTPKLGELIDRIKEDQSTLNFEPTKANITMCYRVNSGGELEVADVIFRSDQTYKIIKSELVSEGTQYEYIDKSCIFFENDIFYENHIIPAEGLRIDGAEQNVREVVCDGTAIPLENETTIENLITEINGVLWRNAEQIRLSRRRGARSPAVTTSERPDGAQSAYPTATGNSLSETEGRKAKRRAKRKIL